MFVVGVKAGANHAWGSFAAPPGRSSGGSSCLGAGPRLGAATSICCTKGALYDDFGSKAGLFLALLDEQFANRIEQAQHADRQSPSKAMPFDREFALLFLEFVCAAGRDAKLRRRLATRLHELRSHTTARVGDRQLAAALGAAGNGASIEALIFGEPAGAETFDLILASLLRGSVVAT
jgi:AcrR family transcriptional regulator